MHHVLGRGVFAEFSKLWSRWLLCSNLMDSQTLSFSWLNTFLSNKNSWRQIADYRNPSSSHFTQTPSQAHYASRWSLHILSLLTGSKAKWFVDLHEHVVQQYSNSQWCSPLRWRQSLNTYYIPPERSIHQCVTESLREHLMQRVGPTGRADPPTKLPEEINHLPVSSK